MLGLAVVLIALGGFSAWAAFVTSGAVAQLERSERVSDAYERARVAVVAQEALLLRYRAERAADSRIRFASVSRSLRLALEEVARDGTRADARVVRRLLHGQDVYTRAIDRFFTAVDQGKDIRARTLQSEVDAVFVWTATQIDARATAHRLEARSSLRSLRDTERLVVSGTSVALLTGSGLLAFFGTVLVRYRHRIDEATRLELERLEQAAHIDSLTGLRNHRAFHEDIARDLERARRRGTPLSLVMLDLDGLKETNDLHGHQRGDEHLVLLAGVLLETLRRSDIAFRVAGDEFVVTLAGERLWGAIGFANRLFADLASASGGNVTVTAGVAEATPLIDKDELIRRADLALIEAKRLHRNVLTYSDDLEPEHRDPDSELQEHHIRTLATALARAVDAKDSSTRNHCETVAELAVLIGHELEIGSRRLAPLRLAALLHDVGKIGIADAILKKPGSLDAAEMAVMRTHSALGENIVEAAERPLEARWIRLHHERIDGTGYPDRLRGDEIPIEARIIHVADAFEAITADRPYRERRSAEEALAELQRHAGTQFDPDCVAALERALAQGDASTNVREDPVAACTGW